MAHVWAHRKGYWSDELSGTGWTHHVSFGTLRDIAQQLSSARFQKASVYRLAIVTHGPQGGQVELDDGVLEANTVARYTPDLALLRPYLMRPARIIFGSCLAGLGKDGTALLTILSRDVFPGCHVIGFEKFGYVGVVTMEPTTVGQIACVGSGDKAADGSVDTCNPPAQGTPMNPMQGGNILNEYSWYAKWGWKGKIIKLPLSEQSKPGSTEYPTVFGVRAVAEAVRQPNSYREIAYVAVLEGMRIEGTSLGNLLYQKNFTGAQGAWKLRKLPQAELTRLAHTSAHQGIVAVGATITGGGNVVYRCAAGDACPTHKRRGEFCFDFVKNIEYGPTKPSH